MDGRCPLGPCDIVVSSLEGPWAPSMRAAWAETSTPMVDATDLAATDPTERLQHHIWRRDPAPLEAAQLGRVALTGTVAPVERASCRTHNRRPAEIYVCSGRTKRGVIVTRRAEVQSKAARRVGEISDCLESGEVGRA